MLCSYAKLVKIELFPRDGVMQINYIKVSVDFFCLRQFPVGSFELVALNLDIPWDVGNF